MGSRRARVLLIDDDTDFVKATSKVLSSKPEYEVITACNGREGLEKARAEKPDLILLDIIMPMGDGFSVCEELRSDPGLEDVPVLMLTSFGERYGDTSLAVGRGYGLEADDYLVKPIRPTELFERIERQLVKRRQQEN